jgi:uncharacterized protein YhbP (UPF0306 family)
MSSMRLAALSAHAAMVGTQIDRALTVANSAKHKAPIKHVAATRLIKPPSSASSDTAAKLIQSNQYFCKVLRCTFVHE